MADFYRLVVALLLCVLSWSAGAVPKVPMWTATPTGGSSTTGSTALAACAPHAEVNRPTNGWASAQSTLLGTDNNGFCQRQGYDYQWQLTMRTQASLTSGSACPANSTPSGSSCVCAATYTDNGTSCIPPPPVNNCKAGASAGRYQYPQIQGRSVASPYFLCDGATPSGNSDGSVCVIRVEGSMATGGVVYGEAFFTGSKMKMTECTGGGGTGGTSDTPVSGNSTPPLQGQPAPTPCKAGEAPGSVNGITKCYPAGSTGQPVTTSDDKETTTTPPAGGASAPTAPNDAGNIGAPQCVGTQCTTSTKSETTCTGDKCITTATTTTTTTDANGNTTTKTGSTTTTGSKGGFCAENPNSQQCETGSFGGSCSAGFSCDGDAVMCAIALDQHKRSCEIFEPGGPGAAALEAERAKTELSSSEVDISPAAFSVDPLIPSACIPDRAVTVVGKTFMVPFSSVCPSLALIGNVFFAVSFLLAARIVARG